MRYLGGKSRLAKEIAAVVAPRGRWWDPFCGGLSVAVQLAKYGPGLVSDVHPALIALYRAVRDGWTPPATVTREDYAAARSLADSNPLKAFVGFGCSFGGKWFGGIAAEQRERVLYDSVTGPRVVRCDQVAATERTIRRDLAAIADCAIKRCSFFAVAPTRGMFEAIYCDPPYRGVTAAYGHVEPFDHDRFWQRCAEWAAVGARVFVSEYQAGAPSVVAWERAARDRLRAADGSQRVKLERLFRVLPAAEPLELLRAAPDNDNGFAPHVAALRKG